MIMVLVMMVMMGGRGLNFNNMTFRVDGDDSDANGVYDGNSDGGDGDGGDGDGCQVQHGGGWRENLGITARGLSYSSRHQVLI